MKIWNTKTNNQNEPKTMFETITKEFFVFNGEKFECYAEWSGMGMNGICDFQDFDDMLTSCSIDFKKKEFLLSWIYDYSDGFGSHTKESHSLAFPFAILDLEEDGIKNLAEKNKLKKEELDRLSYLAKKHGYELKEIL